MFKALYRKYRPLRFEDVVGQSHVTETLRREVDSGHVSHAYLFTGTRGTGKTTCAKILSRAVNCERPERGDPCNECPACLGILSGANLDVIEIDAASNSGVDNIRSLRDESVYAPVNVKKRVYIIDEVHMLSIGAFNALLKTLEEPPEHVLFILATTETHKVPATILSRCQRFAFRRIGREDIAQSLRNIAQAEGIELAPDAAALLAGLSDGAMRDALSLLDQCASASGGKVDTQAVNQCVGLAGGVEIVKWARDIAQNRAELALQRLDRMLAAGRDAAGVLDELCGVLRDLLMAHTMAKVPPLSALSLDEQSVKGLMALWEPKRTLRAVKTIQDAQAGLNTAGSRRIAAEVCVLKLCEMTIDNGQLTMDNAPAGGGDAKESGGGAAGSAAVAAKTETTPAPKAVPPFWTPLLPRVMGHSRSMMQVLQNAKPALSGGTLTITAADETGWQLLRKAEHLDFLRREIALLHGSDLRVEIKRKGG